MRVFFIGSQNIGYACLEELLKQGHDVIAVGTIRPDPHEIVWYKSVQELAELHGLPCEMQPDLKSEHWIRRVRATSLDLICVMGWRRLIAPEILTVPRLGSVAIHFSLLPEGKGFAPVNWAIIVGKTHTGATLFYLDEGMDTGDIIAQVEVPIAMEDAAKDLNDKLTDASVAMFRDMLPKLAEGAAPRTPQDNARATYYAKRIPDDGKLDWTQPALKVYNQIRALTHPYPGAFCYYGERLMYVWKARFSADNSMWHGTPGQVVRFEPGGSAWVLAGGEVLEIEQVQIDGESPVPAGDCLNSLNIRLR